MSQTIEHYSAYRPRPFTVDERKDVTLLFGGLTWKHERLVQGTFENMGYRAMPLPNIARQDLDVGKELIDTGACCPTIFTTGSLARFLKDRSRAEGAEAVAKKYVFLTAGACGPCRFGQYHESYAMALDGLGLRDFRMFLLDQTQMDQGQAQGGGLDVNLPFSLGTIWALLCADLLTDMEYRTRPYEVVPGETDRVLKETVELLYDAFRNRPRRGGKAGTAGLAPAHGLLHEGAAEGVREVGRDRGGSPAGQTTNEDHRRVLAADARRRGQLRHQALAGA